MDNHDDLFLPDENVPHNLPVEPMPQNPDPVAKMAPETPVAPENPLVPPAKSFTPPAPTPPQPPAPMPDFSVPPEPVQEVKPEVIKENKFSVLGISVLIVSIIIIIGLAFLFYYYATHNYFSPVVTTKSTNTTTTTKPAVTTTPAFVTKVIAFGAPEVLPTVQKTGTCLSRSLATGRADAYKCTVGTATYDPCFKTAQNNVVFCQMNPTNETSFTIKLTKPLPAITQPASLAENSAWFVKLRDGTICSPFTGTQPTINGMTGVYGCRPKDKTQQILLGALTKSGVWTAQESIAEKQGTTWVEKSNTKVEVDTVWQ